MELDDKSLLNTTFQTPFEQFKFNKFYFGLSSVSELFMAKTDTFFGDLKGYFPYFDDLIIAGTSRS